MVSRGPAPLLRRSWSYSHAILLSVRTRPRVHPLLWLRWLLPILSSLRSRTVLPCISLSGVRPWCLRSGAGSLLPSGAVRFPPMRTVLRGPTLLFLR